MDLDHLVNSLKVKQGYALFHESNTPSREGFRDDAMRVRMMYVYLRKRCVSLKTASRSLLAPYRLYLQKSGQNDFRRHMMDIRNGMSVLIFSVCSSKLSKHVFGKLFLHNLIDLERLAPSQSRDEHVLGLRRIEIPVQFVFMVDSSLRK